MENEDFKHFMTDQCSKVVVLSYKPIEKFVLKIQNSENAPNSVHPCVTLFSLYVIEEHRVTLYIDLLT